MDRFGLDVITVAYQQRHLDAEVRARDALRRALAAGDDDAAAEIGALIAAHHGSRLQRTDGPTAEALAQRSRRPSAVSPIDRLLQMDSVTIEHAVAAREIASIYTALTKRVACRCQTFQRAPHGAGATNGLALPDRLAWRYEARYLPWTRWMRDPDARHAPAMDRPHLALVLAVVVHEVGLVKVSTVFGLGTRRVTRLLRSGLDRYGDFIANSCRDG